MNILEVLKTYAAPDRLIVYAMVICMAVGALDYLMGDKWRLGSKFIEGFRAFGSLAITMTGILVLVPLIEKYVAPALIPLCRTLGIDPSMFAGTLLACDMGSYQLAERIALSPEGAALGGMILSSMMGATVVFNIPVALGIISKDDHAAMARGMLFGFVTVPVGCFVGGLMAGCELLMLLRNLIPVVIFAAVICVLLIAAPRVIIKVFIVFGQVINVIATIAAVIAIASTLTGFTIIPDLGSATDAMGVVVSVVMILPGAYVMIELLSRALKTPFSKLGGLLGINDRSTLGLLSSLANTVPTFSLIKDMDERGKVINFAFAVGAGFVLGDHLAFCSASDSSLILPLIVGKLTAGVTAEQLASLRTILLEA